MPTYVYETIPQQDGDTPEQFEVKQSMRDAALTRHPENGKPVRRVIVGGYGVMTSGGAAPAPRTEGHCCCGAEGCCH